MIRSTKARVVAGIALLALTVGGLGAVAAVQAQSPTPAPSAVEDAPEANDGGQYPNLDGSIQVPENEGSELSEADESAALAGLAKISSDEASAAAQAQVPGAIDKVELGNENGSLVYEVTIGSQDVKVDAGNGIVLQVEQSDTESHGE